MKRKSRARARRKPERARPRRRPSPSRLADRLTVLCDNLSKALDLDRVLTELLVASGEEAGSTRGAAYVVEPGGRVSLGARFGYGRKATARLADFFGQGDWLRRVVDAGVPRALTFSEKGIKSPERAVLQRAGARAALVVPLGLGKDRLGALVLLSAKADLAARISLFTPAVQLRLGHAAALARAVHLAAVSERQFHNLVQGLGAIVWEADPESFQFTFVSRHAEKLLGYPSRQWVQEKDFWVKHIHPEDRRRALIHCRKAIAQGEDQQFEYRMVAADGRLVWFRDLVHVERDEKGRAVNLSGLLLDVTERRLAESKLTERTTYLTSLIENSPLAVVVLDASHRVQMCNPAFEHLFGYSREEIVGTQLDEVIAPAGKNAEAERFTRRIMAGDRVHATTQRRRKEGSLVDVEIHGVPLLAEGKLIGIFGIYQDRTERQQAEWALRESEERYRLLFESNPHPMWVYDLETLAFLAVNEAATQHYGYTRKEFLSMTIKDIRPAEEVTRLLDNVAHVGEGLDRAGVWKHRKKDGMLIDVDIVSHTIVFAGRRAELVQATDVTEKRILERQLQQATKMEAVGRLAGGIAHDFNNLLMVVRGHTELLRSRAGGALAVGHSLREIEKATERATSLTQQLLAFSRKQMIQPRVLDLNAIVEDMKDMLERLLGEQVELAVDCEGDLGRVQADKSQVEQILLNLGVNARDAMPEGGRLLVRTKNIELEAAYVRQHPGSRPGSYVALEVSDTGVGMDKATQSQIFEPFFTTKELGKGTGMGLSTVYGIVKQNNGYIEVESEKRKGTTFRVYFPRIERAAVAPEKKRAVAVSEGSETLLLVEDEEALRTMVAESLEQRGYRVLRATDGTEALRVAGRHGDQISLVITDVMMPGLSGRELARSLSQLHPEARILYISGYTDDAVVQEAAWEAGTGFLQKPFTLEALGRKVREVLATDQVARPRR